VLRQALAQSEKCQDREDNHDEADEVDNIVHERTLSCGFGAAIYPMLWHNGIMMPKRTSKKSKLRDISQLARAIVEEATGEPLANPALPKEPHEKAPRKKNPAAVALGKLGGKKGGPARRDKLSKERLKEIAQKAARARWSRHTS
jgi:hypothetical protein